MFSTNSKLAPPNSPGEYWSFLVGYPLSLLFSTKDRLWQQCRGIEELFEEAGSKGYYVDGQFMTTIQLTMLSVSDDEKEYEVGIALPLDHFSLKRSEKHVEFEGTEFTDRGDPPVDLIRTTNKNIQKVTRVSVVSKNPLRSSSSGRTSRGTLGCDEGGPKKQYFEEFIACNSGKSPVMSSVVKPIRSKRPFVDPDLLENDDNSLNSNGGKAELTEETCELILESVNLVRTDMFGNAMRWRSKLAAAVQLRVPESRIDEFLNKGERYTWSWEESDTVKTIKYDELRGYLVSQQGHMWYPDGTECKVMLQKGTKKDFFYLQGSKMRRNLDMAVCYAFHGRPTKVRTVIEHIDGELHNCRASNLRWVRPDRSKGFTINCYDKYAQLLGSYETYKAAALATGVDARSIAKCCAGERLTAGKHTWKREPIS